MFIGYCTSVIFPLTISFPGLISTRYRYAPLASLRLFRFNDQFIWGLVGGLALLVVPGLGPVRALGANLLLFFGALYGLRGAGVALFFLAPGRLMTVVMVSVSVLFAGAAGVIFVGLGLGDTWLDWRRRERPST